jgi:hypothetical protein
MEVVDIPVVFICPDHNDKYRERKDYMFTLLKEIGFKNVSMFKSGTENYPLCLAKATYDILSMNLDDNPILLLEDDIETTEWFENNRIEFPENTDAFYLGFSKYGGSKTVNFNEGPSKTEFISTKHIRILNMLSAHAIIYISKRYKEAVVREMKDIIDKGENYYNDVLISRLHEKYNIYGYHYPFFCQSDKLGNVPFVKEATNFRFYEAQNDITVVTAFYKIKSKHPIEKYLHWIQLFFECVSANVICFCSNDFEPIIRPLLRPNHKLVIREFDSFEMMSPKQMTIWENFHEIDPEKDIHTKELYAVWAAKQEFVRESMKLVESNIYIWCDIGIFREKRYCDFKNIPTFIKDDKITFLRVTSYDTFGGGIFAGTKNAINMFSKLYLEELEKNPHGKDQVIYNRILNEENTNIIYPDHHLIHKYNIDEWFYLTYIFSSEFEN